MVAVLQVAMTNQWMVGRDSFLLLILQSCYGDWVEAVWYLARRVVERGEELQEVEVVGVRHSVAAHRWIGLMAVVEADQGWECEAMDFLEAVRVPSRQAILLDRGPWPRVGLWKGIVFAGCDHDMLSILQPMKF